MIKFLLAGSILMLTTSIIGQSGYWDKSKIGFVIGPKFNNSQVLNGVINTTYTFTEKGSLNFGANMVTKFNKTIALNYGITCNLEFFRKKR